MNRKILDPRNAKEHYQSLITKKNTKSVKQKVVTQQPRLFEKPNIVDIKSIIIEHLKVSHKLFRTIRQAEKVGSKSSFYNDTEKKWKFLKQNKNKSKTSISF